MPDTKLTDLLTTLSATPALDDLLHIVDISDTTDDAAGSSKKISVLDLVSRSYGNFVIGNGAAGIDYFLQFIGETNNGLLYWLEDEDEFRFVDVVNIYANDSSSSPLLVVEQDSTGDAGIGWLLTGIQEYRAYIDNPDGDSFKLDDTTGAATFLDFDPATSLLTLGVVGDIILGDSTERDCYPQTTLKINLGKSANQFNNGYFGGTLSIATGALDSGTYTPTLTNVSNVAASIAFQCQYMRLGSVVMVSGRVDVDVTSAASAQLGISLPIASNFGATEDCSGTAFSAEVAGRGAAIRADTTNDRAELAFIAVDLNNRSMNFIFAYEII